MNSSKVVRVKILFFFWCQSQFKDPLLLSSALPSGHPQSFLHYFLHGHVVNPNKEQIQWKKNKWWFFFFLCSFSAGSVPLSGSMSGHTNICADKVCVKWEGLRVWIQGAEKWRFGLLDKSVNTECVTTRPLLICVAFRWMTEEPEGFKVILKSWTQKERTYNECTHIHMPAQMHSVILCFHWNNTVQKWWIFPYLGSFPATREKLAGTEGNTQENI